MLNGTGPSGIKREAGASDRCNTLKIINFQCATTDKTGTAPATVGKVKVQHNATVLSESDRLTAWEGAVPGITRLASPETGLRLNQVLRRAIR